MGKGTTLDKPIKYAIWDTISFPYYNHGEIVSKKRSCVLIKGYTNWLYNDNISAILDEKQYKAFVARFNRLKSTYDQINRLLVQESEHLLDGLVD